MGPTLTYVAMGVVDYPVVLAYDGENPIGAALVKEDRLLMFYVKPSHRRQGIGAQLYRDLEAKVGPNGTDMWWAMPPDDGAAAFYNKMGASM
jgi:GNAT superfamily N-acetyltransferase